VPVLPFAALLPPLHPTSLGAILFTPPNVTIVIAGVVVALLIGGIALRGGAYLHRRREEISAMAVRLGLHAWPDDSLPRGLTLEGTHFHQPHKLTNVHHGIINHREVVIVDIEKQEARSGWSRTILAIRTRERISTPSSLEGRQVGLWKLIYSPVGFSNSDNLMEVEELESLLRNIIH
jgi:hypothetical protein